MSKMYRDIFEPQFLVLLFGMMAALWGDSTASVAKVVKSYSEKNHPYGIFSIYVRSFFKDLTVPVYDVNTSGSPV